MTTTVIVKAHCSADKEVLVEINDDKTGVCYSVDVMQNGEQIERFAYDERVVLVKERVKI